MPQQPSGDRFDVGGSGRRFAPPSAPKPPRESPRATRPCEPRAKRPCETPGRRASPQAALRAQRGAAAEQVAARYLERLGLRILERNVRVGRLEIDILARDGPVVAVVEVRTRGRGAWQRALDSVDPAKQRRLRKAGAALWARRYCREPTIERLRFDIVAVDLDARPEPAVQYVRGAF